MCTCPRETFSFVRCVFKQNHIIGFASYSIISNMFIIENDLSVFDVNIEKDEHNQRDSRLSAARTLDSSTSDKRRNTVQPIISTCTKRLRQKRPRRVNSSNLLIYSKIFSLSNIIFFSILSILGRSCINIASSSTLWC